MEEQEKGYPIEERLCTVNPIDVCLNAYNKEFFRWGASSFVVHGWMTLTQIVTLLLMGFSAVGMWVLSRNAAQGTLKPVEVGR